jgi:predicted RNA-binding protein with RPS1 domain
VSELVKSFGELLKQFALSVDIVSETTFNRVRDYVVEYMRNELETAYFGLMTRSVIDGQPGLQTTWSSADQGSATTIRTGDGYTRQVSLCFDQRRALWVVSKDGTPLREVRDPDGFVDLWGGATQLPMYMAPVDEPMQTSIMLPLVRMGRPLGVMYLESVAHVEATPVAKGELMTLADAIAILIELRDANKSQTEGTDTAVTQLGRFLRTAKFPRLTKPNLFLASADDADIQVLGILREVLAEYDSMVSVFDWQEIADAGAITSQIADRIVRVRDGLEGLIHISELSHQRVAHPGDVVHEGQSLKLKIISLDSERHRLGLSLKQAEEAPARPTPEPAAPGAPRAERRPRQERALDARCRGRAGRRRSARRHCSPSRRGRSGCRGNPPAGPPPRRLPRRWRSRRSGD